MSILIIGYDAPFKDPESAHKPTEVTAAVQALEIVGSQIEFVVCGAYGQTPAAKERGT